MQQAKGKSILHTQFEAIWIKQYQVEKFCEINSFFLKDISGFVQRLLVNGKHLKHFFR